MAFHQQQQSVEDLWRQRHGLAIPEQLLVGWIQEKVAEFVGDLGSVGHICHRGRNEREYISNAAHPEPTVSQVLAA